MAKPAINMFRRHKQFIGSNKQGSRVEEDSGEYEFRQISIKELQAEGMRKPLLQNSGNYKTKWITKNRERQVIVKLLTKLNSIEAELLSHVNHKNIVQFYGAIIEQVPPTFGIVYEFCDGGTLFDYLRRNSLDVSQVQFLAKGVALGMCYLHYDAPDAPIKHNQLTSIKIMLHHNKRGDLVPKIGGFGYTSQHRNTQVSMTFGKMQVHPWMAPERIKGEGSTPASDVYSFGIILWELITGELPSYHDMPLYQALTAIVSGQRPVVPAHCSKDWGDLMSVCWAPEPKDRPEFAEVLEKLEFHCLHTQQLDLGQPSQVKFTAPRSSLSWELAEYEYDNLKFSGGGSFAGSVNPCHISTYKGLIVTGEAEFSSTMVTTKSVDRIRVKHDQFMSYMTVISEISHENIVKLIGAFTNKQVILLQWMPKSLRQAISTDGPITDRHRFRKIASGIALGLEHLHSQHPCPIVHGGLTSNIVMLDQNETAKICDISYGFLDDDIGHAVDDDDSVYYDNTIENRRQSRKGDVYSFGVLLYEMRSSVLPSKKNHWVLKFVRENWPELSKLAHGLCSKPSHERPSITTVIKMLSQLQ